MIKFVLIFFLLIFYSILNAQPSDSDTTKRHSIKFDFFSPVNGCLGLSLETVKSKVFSYDVEAGFIGMNLGDYYYYDSFVGAYGGFGFRFYLTSENKRTKDYKIFEGVYLKPSLSLNYFYYTKGQIGLEDITGADFSISQFVYFGDQVPVFDVMVFDFWFGLGYGKNWISEKNPDSDFIYNDGFHDFGHIQLGDSPLLFDAGFSIGYIF